MSKFIYLITSPSSKSYVGQSSVLLEDKIRWYKKVEKYDKTDRKIANAIKKYGWENMKFEVIEENPKWSKKQLNAKEIQWIKYYLKNVWLFMMLFLSLQLWLLIF